MTGGTLPFSHSDYDKLQHRVFPTIRRRDKFGAVGDVNEIMVGPKGERDSWGKAEIIAKETVTLQTLPTSLLCWDTETHINCATNKGMSHRRQAKQSINEFYQNPIQPEEDLTLYWNRWVDDD